MTPAGPAALFVAVPGGGRLLGNAHPPDVGPVLGIAPGELTRLFGLHLVVERPGVMVVDYFHRHGRTEAAECGEDERMALTGGDLTYVDAGGHGFLSHKMY